MPQVIKLITNPSSCNQSKLNGYKIIMFRSINLHKELKRDKLSYKDSLIKEKVKLKGGKK